MTLPYAAGASLAAARTRLGLTPDRFAVELGLTPHSYQACEDGTATLPKHQAQLVAYKVACADRDEALAKSGLPTCGWVEQWTREAPPADAKLKQRVAHLERLQAHTGSCATCAARDRFVKEHFPNMPEPPVAGWVRVVGSVKRWIDARPEWMRPALNGACIVGVLTSARAALMLLVGGVGQPRMLLLALGAIVLSTVAGACGGLVYYFVGKPARRVPVAGPYLAGIITTAGYLGCSLGLLSLLDAKGASGGDLASSLFAFGMVAIVLGLVVGHTLFRRKVPA